MLKLKFKKAVNLAKLTANHSAEGVLSIRPELPKQTA